MRGMWPLVAGVLAFQGEPPPVSELSELREKIASAVATGVPLSLRLRAGVHFFLGGTPLNVSCRAIVSLYGEGAEGATLDGGGESRVVLVERGATLLLRGVHLVGGYEAEGYGGCALVGTRPSVPWVQPATLFVEGGRIAGCGAKGGGGVAVMSDGVLRLSSCTVADCQCESAFAANAQCGAVLVGQGNLTMLHSTVWNASSVGANPVGGGVSILGGFTSIQSSGIRSTSARSPVVGGSAHGGGVSVQGTMAQVEIYASTIASVSAQGPYPYGGGIFVEAGTVVISACLISNASVEGENAAGGGVFVQGGTVSMLYTVVVGSVASGPYPYGGGVFVRGGVATLISCTVVDCQVTGENDPRGGGVFVLDGTVQLSGCRVLNTSSVSTSVSTSAAAYGGGIYAWGGTFDLSSSTVAGAAAVALHADGGGVYVKEHATFSLEGSSIVDSAAFGDFARGGGIFLASSTLTSITNCSIAGAAARGAYGVGGCAYIDASPSGSGCGQEGVTLSHVALASCAAYLGAALFAPAGAHGEAHLTAAYVTISHRCAADEPPPSLLEGSGIQAALLRALHVSAAGCTDPLHAVELIGCATPPSQLPRWLPLSPPSVCGPQALCTPRAAAEGAAVTSAFCSCAEGTIPSPRVRDASTAPYVLASYAGCISPLVAENLTRLDLQSAMALVTLTKTEDDAAPYVDIALTLRVSGTLWNMMAEGANASYPWHVLDAAPAPWLSVLNASGVVVPPREGSVTTAVDIGVRVSARGLAAGHHDATVHTAVQLPTMSDMQRTVAQLAGIATRVIVSAPAVPGATTLDGGQPLPLPATLYATTLLTFTVRDAEGLPTDDAVRINASLLACDGRGDCSFEGSPSVRKSAQGQYALQLIVTRLGAYRVHLVVDGAPLTHGAFAHLAVEAVCDAYEFSRLAIGLGCAKCPATARCGEGNASSPRRGATLASLDLLEGYWRLSNGTTDIRKCDVDGTCVGGPVVGGYCAEGFTGPVCHLCAEPRHHRVAATCESCPAFGFAAVAEAGGLLLLAAACAALLAAACRRSSACRAIASRGARRAIDAAVRLGLVPKLKLLLGYYQVVVAMPEVFQVPLPQEYKGAMRVFSFVHMNWLSLFVPSTCLGSYSTRLTLEALTPLLFFAALILGSVVHQLASARRGGRGSAAASTRSLAARGALRLMPYVLFLCFAFAPTLSSLVFSVFACDTFGYSDKPEESWSFLHADYTVRCSYGAHTSSEHEAIKMVAFPYILVWPIGVPLLFGALLFWAELRRTRSASKTLLAPSISFLRKEYIKSCWFWEVAELGRKEVLTGFLLLVPQELNFLRIVLAMLLSLCHVVLLAVARPYRSSSTAFVALLTSFTLCCTIFSSLLVKFISYGSPAAFGVDGAFRLSMIILAFNFGVIAIAVAFFSRQVYEDARAPVLLLKSTGQRPRLELAATHRWALFISHSWDNQDIAGLIKRQLQLLLPGVSVFLDVDDLHSVDALEEYVSSSAVLLVLLGSTRYFSSDNCLREVQAAKLRGKPLCLVHESDPQKQGAPLHVLKMHCPVDLFGFIFFDRPVLPWHRLYAFQCVTMMSIATDTLLHSPAYSECSTIALELPGDIRDQPLAFEQQILLYASRANQGAAQLAFELQRLAPQFRNRGADTSRLSIVSRSSEGMNSLEVTDIEPLRFDEATCFLLYLNSDTFVQREPLHAEVSRALASGAKFCLVYETDPKAGGSAFGSIMSAAGSALISAGLFTPLAIPLHSEPGYRAVSLKLALKAIGAKAAGGSLRSLRRWIPCRRRAPVSHRADEPSESLLRLPDGFAAVHSINRASGAGSVSSSGNHDARS